MSVRGRVSCIVPSRNERFTYQTVSDLLAKARGDVEIILVLDGWWPPSLPDDKRLIVLHRGDARGMRPGINAAARMASGEFLLKCDGHTMWAEGFDETLKAEHHEDNWVIVPRRYALDAENWTIDTSNPKYPIDYHFLSYPYERPDDPTCGLHGTVWPQRKIARADVLLDDEMSSQGSGWFMSRTHWARIGDLESALYGNFVHEFQEVGLKTWLGGGAVKVTKRTWYAHLYKGRKYGRGYSLGPDGHRNGSTFCTTYWMGDQYPKAVRTLRWLVEHFAPVPTWPADLDLAFRRAAA